MDLAIAQAPSQPFSPPAIPWRSRVELPAAAGLNLGPGLEAQALHGALVRLWALGDIEALVVFGSRARGMARPDSDLDLAVILRQPQLSPEQKARCWWRCRQAIGRIGVGLDLVVVGQEDAERLSGSRWHVLGDVAREGQVLCSAGSAAVCDDAV